MNIRRLIAQMVVVRACGHLYDRQIQYPQWEQKNDRLQSLVMDHGIGGVILLGGSAPEIYLRTQQLQAWADHPLLIAADVEEGVGQRFAGGTRFPPPMALEQCPPERAYEYGRVTAQEGASLGINWLLAPVADINSNPRNPVINIRAFGNNPDVVMPRVSAFIKGAHTQPVLTTAKHFPGHGDTTIDSHLATPVLNKSLDQLRSMELLPFQTAIAAGVDSIMTAHLLLPQIDNKIATLSKVIVTELLRQELGFSGLIVTDALIMAGISDRCTLTETVIGAILAGHDMLLMPPDPINTINIILQAVKNGIISLDRVYESVNRIWQYKAKINIPSRLPNLDNYDNQRIAYNLAQDTIIIIHPGEIKLQQNKFINLILTDRLDKSPEFFNSPAASIPNSLGATTIYGELRQLDYYNLPKEQSLFVQIYSRGNPFQGNLSNVSELIKFLQDKNLLGGILYGNPYLIPPIKENLPQPWLFSYGHYGECQKICLDRLLKPSPVNSKEFTN